jgi:hypothetical protein
MRRRRVGGAEVQLHSFLTPAVDGGEWWTPRFGGRFTRCPPIRRLGGLWSWSGRFGEEKNLVPLPGVAPEVQVMKLVIMQFSLFPCYRLLDPNIFRCSLFGSTFPYVHTFCYTPSFTPIQPTGKVTVLYIVLVILEFSGSKGEGNAEMVKVN